MGISSTFLIEDVHHGVDDRSRHTLTSQDLTASGGEILGERTGIRELQHDDRRGLARGNLARENIKIFFASKARSDRLKVTKTERLAVCFQFENLYLTRFGFGENDKVQQSHDPTLDEVTQSTERVRIRTSTFKPHEIKLSGAEAEVIHRLSLSRGAQRPRLPAMFPPFSPPTLARSPWSGERPSHTAVSGASITVGIRYGKGALVYVTVRERALR